jgi:hypothetical protein
MLLFGAALGRAVLVAAAEEPAGALVLKSTENAASLRYAVYPKATGLELIDGLGSHSADNGRTWAAQPVRPDFDSKLPHGYRREPLPVFVDPVDGRIVKLINSMDTPGLDPNIIEPPVAQNTYYLRYRVSVDGGKTYLFDEPIVQDGMTAEHPFDGVYCGKNAIYIGDIGSRIIRTRSGRIIVPAIAPLLGLDGKLSNPGGGGTYDRVVLLLGTWREDNKIRWEVTSPIEGDPTRSTRGMDEPTLAEMPDGRLLCVMRGSNGGRKDPECKLTSYRWCSVSADDGRRWTKPEPWTYDDGQPFFSPASMSQLLRHSSGRYLWIGNISPSNCRANDPRYPLVIGEVDGRSLRLIRNTILVIDTKRPEEPGVNLSHWWGFEDRATKEVVIVGARHSPDYTTSSPITYRVGVR